jgi:hypothetical protein
MCGDKPRLQAPVNRFSPTVQHGELPSPEGHRGFDDVAARTALRDCKRKGMEQVDGSSCLRR